MCVQVLGELKGRTEEVPCVVGDEHVWTSDIRYQLSVRSRLLAAAPCRAWWHCSHLPACLSVCL